MTEAEAYEFAELLLWLFAAFGALFALVLWIQRRSKRLLVLAAVLILGTGCASTSRCQYTPGPTLQAGDHWLMPWDEDRNQSCCRCGYTHTWRAHPWVVPAMVPSPGPGGWGWSLSVTGRRVVVGVVLELVGIDEGLTEFHTRRLLGVEARATGHQWAAEYQ